jgi:hypothetical protein
MLIVSQYNISFMVMGWTPPEVWLWLRGGLPQGYVQFNVECDLMQYDTKLKQLWESTCGIFWVKTISRVFKEHPKKTICK